MLKSML